MKIVKAIVRILFVLALIVGVVLTIIHTRKKDFNQLEVRIHTTAQNLIITEQEIENTLRTQNIIRNNMELQDIDFSKITELLSQEIYIKKVNHIGFEGSNLVVELTLKDMLIHIFPKHGNDYFVSTDGEILPYSARIKEKMLIANGNISTLFTPNTTIDSFPKSQLESLFKIASFMQSNSFYVSQFQQLYVNSEKQIELIPTVSTQNILIGNGEELEQKFSKIDQIYQKGLYLDENNQYRQFDIRFRDRIIAKK